MTNHTPQTVGQMIAISVVFSRVLDFTPWAFKLAFACQWAFAGFAVVVGIFIPESPVYLVSRERIPAAEKSIKLIYGSSGTSTAERIQQIRATIEHEQSFAARAGESGYAECFRGSNWRRTRIVALLNTLQQFIGVSLVANSTYFFIMAGMSPDMSLTINQIGVGLSMVCTLISWVVITKVGRRRAILSSFVVAGVIFLAMGIVGFWPANPTAIRYVPRCHCMRHRPLLTMSVHIRRRCPHHGRLLQQSRGWDGVPDRRSRDALSGPSVQDTGPGLPGQRLHDLGVLLLRAVHVQRRPGKSRRQDRARLLRVLRHRLRAVVDRDP